jgi:hypothetical protein
MTMTVDFVKTDAGTGKPQHFALTIDELELLEVYRKAKAMKFADIAVTIQEGKRVKMWLTEKMR